MNATDYNLLEEIGFGASATVFRAIYLPYNEVVAIKCLDLDRCNSNLVRVLLILVCNSFSYFVLIAEFVLIFNF